MLSDMRKILTAAVVAVSSPVFLCGQSALGAEGKLLAPPASEQAANPQEPLALQPDVAVVPPSGPPIVIEASGGTLLRLPGPARTVFVADSDVADVQVQAQQREFIYVNAKKGGRTVLYAADEAGHILLNKYIEVIPGPVTIIRAGTLSVGGEPTPLPLTTVTQSTTATQGSTATPQGSTPPPGTTTPH